MKKNLSNAFSVTCAILFLLPGYNTAQPWAVERLESSPRHHEWVSLKSGNRTLQAFVTFPETSKKAPLVLVIHENRGLTDWVRLFTDRLAAEGFIALAPDLLSGTDSAFARTSDYPNQDAARDALYKLIPDTITADLNRWKSYLSGLKSGNKKIAVAGFCWGGSQTFRYATNADGVAFFAVFYGGAPADSSVFTRIKAPVYGFYAENDARINEGIPVAQKWMDFHKKKYETVTYPGAGHAFMRRSDDPEEKIQANKDAGAQGFDRLISLLNKLKT